MCPNIKESTAQSTAVALVSGGLDSSVSLGLAHQTHQILLGLTIDYGQRAFSKEYEAASALCKHYQVKHKVIELPWLKDLLPPLMSTQSTLSGDWDSTSIHQKDFWQVQGVWVPNRNGVLLNIAAAFAENLGAKAVIFGANADEAEDFPDNTQAYRDALTHAFQYSTLNHVAVITPVATLSKTEIVKAALANKIPLEYVWSCYTNNAEPCHCCPSCVRLDTAKQQALVTI